LQRSLLTNKEILLWCWGLSLL